MQKVVRFIQPETNAPRTGEKREAAAAVASAIRTLNLETEGLALLATELGGDLAEPFEEAVRRLAAVSGRVIVTGIGKSGHVGQKIAATFASTGTPAFFVHPSEASHGDLGMVTRSDLILALSWSGETVELKPIITYSRRFAVPLVGSRPAGRRRVAATARQGSLPARPGADDVNDDATGARRRPCDRAARSARLHGP
jgi:arabinose-5-phosphate isomerase